MSDEHLRELERRFRASGSLDDERAWLVERLRAGSLPRARLELAAWVGHEAAHLVAPDAPVAPPDLEVFILDLARWEFSAVVRAAVALSRVVLRSGDAAAPALAPLIELVDAVDAWLGRPDDAALERVSAAGRALTLPVILQASVKLPRRQGALTVQSCLGDVMRLAQRRRGEGQAHVAAARVLAAASHVAQDGGPDALRVEIAGALARWALG